MCHVVLLPDRRGVHQILQIRQQGITFLKYVFYFIHLNVVDHGEACTYKAQTLYILTSL